MTKKEKIEKIIKEVFEKYNIPLALINDAKNQYNSDTIFESDKADEKTITIIANILGVENKTIENCDKNKLLKIYNENEFFTLYNEFKMTRAFKKFDLSEVIMHNFLKVLKIEHDTPTPKYSPEKIQDDLIKYLEQLDKKIPGTLHNNAKIFNLQTSSEDFCSFTKLPELLNSYFKLLDRIEILFFKAINNELNEDEIQEYNTYISFTGAVDRLIPRQYMYYNYIQVNKEGLKKQSHSKFLAYSHFSSYANIEPWTCIEFLDNRDLAQKYVNYFPESKSKMTHFNMLTKNVLCEFCWSDDRSILDDFKDDDSDDEIFNECFNELIDNMNKLYGLDKPIHSIYIPKSEDDIKYNLVYCKKLQQYILPPKKGGLTINQSNYGHEDAQTRIKLMMARVIPTKAGM